MAPTSALRDKLLSSLATLPGTRRLHLHVLVSTPRKHSDLFPYATAAANPRVVVQSLLILCSEESPIQSGSNSTRAKFVAAVESYVYTVAATRTTILNLSKVDSTGQGLRPSPTQTIVRALLCFFADPINRSTEHLWIHVFSRAQNQYLFPNSVEHPSKHVLSDVKLCQWYTRLLTEVAEHTQKEGGVSEALEIKPHYFIAGMEEVEARMMLGQYGGSSGPNSMVWTYGHPYSQAGQKMPSGVVGSSTIAEVIPWFPDDPKSRFIDELYAPSEAPMSPPRKKTKHTPGNDSDDGKPADKPPRRRSVTTNAAEFWEMMSFRQECASGRITGFFVLCVNYPPKPNRPVETHAEPGQVSKNVIKRTLKLMLNAHEFSTDERTETSTEILETSIRGLCEGLKENPLQSSDQAKSTDEKRRLPPPQDGAHAEDLTSLDVYHRHIYGSCFLSNPSLPPRIAETGTKRSSDAMEAAPVTILTVKKKKKRA